MDQGHTPLQVAGLLDVSERSIRRGSILCRTAGEAALKDRSATGRPTKLDEDQVQLVLSWLRLSPGSLGFATEQWTAVRVAELIERELGVHFHPRYLNQWLSRHDITPQIPTQSPQERDEKSITRWVQHTWPRIKKKRSSWTQAWFSPMKQAF